MVRRLNRHSCLKAVVLLLLFGLVSVSTQAKYGKYLHRTNPANGTSKILKITRDGSLRREVTPKTLGQPASAELPRRNAIKPILRPAESSPPRLTEYLSANQLRSPPDSPSLA